MEYKNFCENVMKQIKKYLPEESNVKNVKIYETVKMNGVKKVGLVFEDSMGEAQPAIYLEEFYAEFQAGTTIKEICEWIAEVYQEAMNARPKKEMCDFSSYADFSDKICMRLVNYELNKEFLESGVPHKKVEDLAIYYVLHLHTGKQGMASVVVRDELVNAWKISLDELHDKAEENTLHILKPKLCSISDLLMGEDINLLETGSENEEKEALYALVAEEGKYGAALLMFPSLMERIKEIIGAYYIIPSSVHEILLVDKKSADPVMLGGMIRDVNKTSVNREEWLSFHAYEIVQESEGFHLKIVEESKEY